ncbi:RepB plasmid partitioning protein [Marinibacterium anthonyi]|nr:RepB plasmid partitioning protein [Marinibacterium anthonyi]
MRGREASRETGASQSEPDVPAVAYVRMSTDHQKYSTENQLDVIRSYAAARGLQILRVFEDSGRSGLRLDGREALQNLMGEVQSGQADFKAILVYDVSRWGRFQDADEGAYHEHVCSRAGIRVHYCGEQFENDGSIGSNLLKTVKRVMAGEYSRELSVKVFAGQCRLVELGFRQGGAAGYGLRRVLIDEHGNPKGELSRGEQKSLQTDRVILVPGPEEEQQVVQRMYEMFVNEGRPERAIAEVLNAEGHRTDLDRPWTRATVHQVLTNEKYIGNNVFAKVSFKLKQRRVVNPREMWIRAEGAYVNAILAGTPQAQLVESSKPKKVKGITPEAMARMEQELARLQEGIASIQDTYGQDHLHLTVIKGYVGKLLGNARVVRYLAQNHPEFLGEFQTITEITPTEAAEAE